MKLCGIFQNSLWAKKMIIYSTVDQFITCVFISIFTFFFFSLFHYSFFYCPQIFFAVSIPLDIPNKSVSVSFYFEANYRLPDGKNSSYFDEYFGVRSFDRRLVYEMLQSKLERWRNAIFSVCRNFHFVPILFFCFLRYISISGRDFPAKFAWCVLYVTLQKNPLRKMASSVIYCTYFSRKFPPIFSSSPSSPI